MKDHPLDSNDLAWLAGLARALLGEAHAADDLVQDTVVAATGVSLPAGAPRRAWLASVARRLAARRFRSDARRARREERAAQPEALPDSAELLEKAEVAEQVTAAARRLPEPYRRTILLRYLEARSAEEIAREEGKPVDTVRWRVRRGLELLREELMRGSDRDWSAWSVLLLPLARIRGDVGLATAGATGVATGTVASWAVMKATIASTVALGCAGIWFVWDQVGREPGDSLAVVSPPAMESPASSSDIDPQPVVAFERPEGDERTLVGSPATEPEATAEIPEPKQPVTEDLVGRVVDEEGEPIAGATVYLVPSEGAMRTETESDWRGTFRFAPRDWRLESEFNGEANEPALDLGVAANGFLRRFVPDVMSERSSDDELVVVLECGRTLAGRVVDELGRPVSGLDLLVYTAYAGIGHVSPSQRLLRAWRNIRSSAKTSYEQCRATTDDRGEIMFTGLPPGDLNILPLAPGWTIEDPQRVEADGSYIVWTAQRRLGVKLTVVDAITGQPVEQASAVFRMDLTFEDGEVREFEQWVGRGAGEVSFVVDSEILPGLDERTIRRAVFHGTARAGESQRVNWRAEPIVDNTGGTAGATGVAEVRVEIDPSIIEETEDKPKRATAAATSALVLDVRYEDSAPFEGSLKVMWIAPENPEDRDYDRTDKAGLGHYRAELPAGTWRVQVSDRFASGSLPAWEGEARCEPGGETLVFATLPRGGTATILRPDGWSGEWFVHASYRADGDEEWFGSWGYGTDETSLTLPVMRPAEWRFELRRDSAFEANPLVRTVMVEEGETVLVED